MAVPVIVITGFLGCGKTSFLRNLLPLCGEARLRPALIINEVGDVDVDGELLADVHAEQVRLVGGCICCTLQTQLSNTIYDILEQGIYNLIIIECSGLSNPLDVVNALSAPALIRKIAVSHIICLFDAGRAEKVLSTVELARTQAASSDILILNKMDTVETEALSVMDSTIRRIAPDASIHKASYGNIGRESLLEIIKDKAPSHCACGCNHDHHHSHPHHHEHRLPASFCTVALSLPDSVERQTLQNLMTSLPENVVRAKGFANVEPDGWQILHKVYDSIDIKPFGDGAPGIGSILICIGQHLSAEELRRAVSSVLK